MRLFRSIAINGLLSMTVLVACTLGLLMVVAGSRLAGSSEWAPIGS